MADRITGGERGREDRLTDRIGLGVLTRLVHRDLVDEVLADTGRTERRRRLLPARVVVYFVLAMTLFFDDAYELFFEPQPLEHPLRGPRGHRGLQARTQPPPPSLCPGLPNAGRVRCPMQVHPHAGGLRNARIDHPAIDVLPDLAVLVRQP